MRTLDFQQLSACLSYAGDGLLEMSEQFGKLLAEVAVSELNTVCQSVTALVETNTSLIRLRKPCHLLSSIIATGGIGNSQATAMILSHRDSLHCHRGQALLETCHPSTRMGLSIC